jgi:hypothetical protein
MNTPGENKFQRKAAKAPRRKKNCDLGIPFFSVLAPPRLCVDLLPAGRSVPEVWGIFCQTIYDPAYTCFQNTFSEVQDQT